jgi:hypothetical protein
MHDTPKRKRLPLLAAAAALLLSTNVEAQILPIDMDGQGIGWDTQLFEHERGLVQVVALGSDARLGQHSFSPGQSEFVASVRGSDGRHIRTMPEGTPIPHDIGDGGSVGNILYSRHRIRATWVLRRALDGALQSASHIQHAGRDVDLAGRLLPDGGLLLFGSYDRHNDSLGLVMRIDASGRTLWAVETGHRPSPCSEGQGICRFSDVHDAKAAGDLVLASGTFASGTLDVGGETLTRRPQHNGFRVGLDLNTGAVRWLRRQSGETTPVLMGGEFVSIRTPRGRHELRRINADSGRSTRMHSLPGLHGQANVVVPFGDGIAVYSEGRHADRHLQGYDARGEQILYRSGLRPLSQIAASGDSVVLATQSGGDYPNVELFTVERFSPDGTVERSDHPGHWRRAGTYLHSLQSGRVVLAAISHGAQFQLHLVEALGPSPRVAPAMPVGSQPWVQPAQASVRQDGHAHVVLTGVVPADVGTEPIHVSVEARVTIGAPAIMPRETVSPVTNPWGLQDDLK